MKCLEACKKHGVSCPVKDCRLWVEYEKDFNCVGQTVSEHGKLTLREVAKRLNISFVRVKQIEDKALKKLTDFANKLSI